MKTVKTNLKPINYGDRIFARITRNGQTVSNFVTEKVSCMTDLITEVRNFLKDLKGLVVLHIRNYNTGWSQERPLLLTGVTNNRTSQVASKPSMLFPWETH